MLALGHGIKEWKRASLVHKGIINRLTPEPVSPSFSDMLACAYTCNMPFGDHYLWKTCKQQEKRKDTGRPGVGNRENRESSRWAASLLGRSRILFFDICHVSPSSLKIGYTRSAF